MVFESVLVQVLNRFLGDYVENLDTDQLSVGIWGGDVRLTNLVLKQTALEELDLPVQTVYGRVGKLVLKIPWKNLYGSAIVIDVEDIYLLAAPNQQVKYDPIKEEKYFIESKKKEIQKVDEAKRREADKDKPKADYTFVEKLITQIIKNVQLNIKNIHIRYEDKVTSPIPFSLGITLSELNVVSTDENWTPAITSEKITKIFKIVKLNSLAVYWNCNSPTYANLPGVDLIHKMATEIASNENIPSNYNYILGPIQASARLRLNQKPEHDEPAYIIPKVHLNLEMDKLFIGVSKAQYRDIIALADSMNTMSRGIPFRKYRPNVSGYRGHYDKWWKFAYNCVLDHDVRRQKRNWDWNHIANHRVMCKEYGQLYQKKLRKQENKEDKEQLEKCERDLDIFNIVLIRQRIELETERLERTESKAEMKSWFGWMWGRSASKEQMDMGSSTQILRQFEEAMTPEEKNRLYKAIDYQENASPAIYPEAYIDNSCSFLLKTLEIELRDDENEVKRCLFTELKGVKVSLNTRAAASALRVDVNIKEFNTYGLQQGTFVPLMVTSETVVEGQGLLEVAFETNPLDHTCGQRLHLTANPLKVIYDAATIIKIIDIFKVPSNSALDQIAAAAEGGMSNFKEMSSTGLQYAIDTHAFLDLKIDLRAPYIIIPHGGKFTDNENVFVVNLGKVKIYSVPRPERRDVKQMHKQGMDDKIILQEMINQSYDKFKLELTHMQVLVAEKSENWRESVINAANSPMHILDPVNLNIDLSKCLISDDPRLPLMKIAADLPIININVSDARLLMLVALGYSIPLPPSDVPEPMPLGTGMKKESSTFMLKYLEMQEKAKKTKDLLPSQAHKKDEFVQFTTIDLKFVMKQLCVNVKQQAELDKPVSDLILFQVQNLTLDLVQQTFNTKIGVRLARIGCEQNRQNERINVLSTVADASQDYLFAVDFLQVNKSSPEFHSLYKSCESSLNLEFTKLGVILHREAILEIMKFVNTVQEQIICVTESASQMLSADRIASSGTTGQPLSIITEVISEVADTKIGKVTTGRRKHKVQLIETIKFKLVAQLDDLQVKFQTDVAQLCACDIFGLRSEIVVKEPYTQIAASLKGISIMDLNKANVHKMILSVAADQALGATIVMYNLDDSVETSKVDMSIDVTMGGLRIIFLNLFVSSMLEFLNSFQEAQARIIEASQAAAQTAKENMTNVYAKSTKISLNIDLKAPDIVIPSNSTSFDAVLLDLGHISIRNRFLTLDLKNDKGFSPVIDEMKLTLDHLRLSRIKLDVESKSVKELNLLEPFNLSLIIKRNLSVAWYRAVPDIDISGKMNAITVTISQWDYRTIMSLVDGNLAEGNVNQASDKSKQQLAIEPKSSISTKSSSGIENLHLTQDSRTKVDIDPKVYTICRFTFAMDKIVLCLYTGGSRALNADSPHHEKKNSLGRFSLEGLALKGNMLSDNSLITSFLLVNFFLDDMRTNREDKLNRLIQRSYDLQEMQGGRSDSTESITSRSMIDVLVQMKDGDMFVDVKIYSFTVIISVDYLMKIADFFTGGLANQFAGEGEAAATVEEVASLSQADSSNKRSVNLSIQSKPSTKSKVAKSTEKESQITLNLKVEKPDIILVEHMDNIDTKALMGNCEVLIKLRMAGEHQVINGTIKDLQFYTCTYNPAKRAESRCNVLEPVTISLAGSTPANKGMNVELLVSKIALSVSPATIELLSVVSATATATEVVEGERDEEQKDYSKLWDVAPYTEAQYWFFKGDDADEVTEDMESVAAQLAKKTLQELCIISIPAITLTLEAGVGNKTFPMLIMDSSLKGTVRNWSSQMSVESSLTLQMSYYNTHLALWEPLIEPVQVAKHGSNSEFVPWELKLEVSMNEQEEVTSPVDNETDVIPAQPSLMSIDITSDNTLELTVTKTCLEVMNNLAKAFASAMKTADLKPMEITAPYKVINELGTSVTINLKKSNFELYGRDHPQQVILENNTNVPLQSKDNYEVADRYRHSLKPVQSVTVNSLNIEIPAQDCALTLPVMRADKRFFPMNYRRDTKDNWGLISEVKVDEGVMVVTLRSIIQIYNDFNLPIEVYYMTEKDNELASIAIIPPNSVYNVPLHAVYTRTNELFFSVDGYSVTTTPYVWKELQTNLVKSKTLKCLSKNIEKENKSFILCTYGEMEQVYFESTGRHTMASTCYNIHLRPPVKFKNCLPIDVECCIENMDGDVKVTPGETIMLANVEPGKSCVVVRLPEYLEKEWSSRQEILSDPNEFSVWTFASYDSAIKMNLNLGMHVVNENGSMVMSLYCPFWMLNKTGMNLGYRNSDDVLNILHHPSNFKGPILFSFNAKNFFGKKKAAIKVEQGDWSDKFSLDVAGSSGVVICKKDGMFYQIGVHNQLTYNGLTKQVTFTPRYVIINNSNCAIECQESDRPGDPWVTIEPKSCSALWPKSELDDKFLKLRVLGTNEVSAAFLYTESHMTLLKLKNKYGGVNVDIQLTEGGIYISLALYDEGMAPALIINHTRDVMSFWEKESVQIRKLPKMCCTLYTWENPSGPRALAWDIGNRKEMINELKQDGVGEYSVRENYNIYWVSFLNGMQRILLFTEIRAVAENAQAAKLFEIIKQEITISIHGVGLSLVNNITRQEIMYMGIASSGVIWEQCKLNAKRFKPLSTKDSALIEASYQRYNYEMKSEWDEVPTTVLVDNRTEVDFASYMMVAPRKRKIRRMFQTGLWIQMKTSPNLLQLHAKVNRLQIDNQMYDCIFPVVLAPVPIPKSVAIDSGIKPFAEVSIVQFLSRNSQVKQFKYFKVLVQEFHIKVDLGFVNALVDVLQTSEYKESEEKELFLKDMELVNEPLFAHVSTQSQQEQKSFYDLLHFSPLKIHVSFSMAAGTSAGQSASTPNFLNVLLQGLGVTLTDLQDVVFKLAFFEREFTFLTQKQLISEATSHYVGQSVKQLYVLVLGLDVLGNPYGLVVGITKGVEDLFYEPFQGAIQGPGEFAEGLVLGVRSLFGHTVGGAAGAVSRITGAMGKGIAALTFDEDYQRKRRDQINKKPATVQEGIARSGKGLVMGVFDGVTGVFTKPISGAREEGFGGFFKGLGKGAVGLVARPTAGVVDFASGSLDAVKRATEVGEEANRLRYPRFLQADGYVRPYAKSDAEGNKLLAELEKGKYAKTDFYAMHYNLLEKKGVLLLTDKRCAYITHSDIFGYWQIEWSYTWQELAHPPQVAPKGVVLFTVEAKKKKGLFSSSDAGKFLIPISNPVLREEICERIESLRGNV